MIQKAFVLGAGLGERLRPLTDQLPKPLVPVLHRPLITWAFQHLRERLGVKQFVVNTWHLDQEYNKAFPEARWQDCELYFRKDEPILLDTAGGMANVSDLLVGDAPFIVYNGDVLADFDLQRLLAAHRQQGNMVTLAIRSSGPALHIGFDAKSGRVTDIRNKLGTGNEGTHLFTGVYVVEPAFLGLLKPGVKESVVAVFLRMITSGLKLGACVLDDGQWWDLGSRKSYLELHRLALASTAISGVHETAQIAQGAQLLGHCCIGAGSVVEAGAVLEDCVLWPGARVTAGVTLKRCIVRQGIVASVCSEDADF